MKVSKLLTQLQQDMYAESEMGNGKCFQYYLFKTEYQKNKLHFFEIFPSVKCMVLEIVPCSWKILYTKSRKVASIHI